MVVRSLHCAEKNTNPSGSDSIDQGDTTEHNNLVVSGASNLANDRADCQGVEVIECNSRSFMVERRTSARLQKLNTEKALHARSREDSVHHGEERKVRKKARFQQKRISDMPNVNCELVENKVAEGNMVHFESKPDAGESTNIGLEEVAYNEKIIDKSAYAKVTETLRTFNKHYLHFVQEEEKRVKKQEADRKQKKGSQKKKADAPEDDTKRGSKRPDLKAITKMMETNAVLYPNKRFGSIPGIDVGHQFFSRAEMVAVGFHSHWLNGIDYIGQTASREFSGYKLPLAVAIVLSGQYEDDLDNCEDVVYTGQGGNNLLGNKRQIRDQVMLRGNLALKNCIEQSVHVRVVRGHQSANSYVGKVYTYDGLYKVVSYWAEKGVSGFTVYKFRLKRLEGQPLLISDQVHFSRGRIPNSISEIRGLVCNDITGGQEDIPIPATNLVDDPPVAPTGFIYCKSVQVAKSVKLPPNAPGCKCKGGCIDPKSCSCARLNGTDFPYVHRDGGRLIEPKDVVFECGPNCGCGPGCVNRTSQRGLKYRLEVFRTPKKGWAVRSWDYIPSGAPVCEYVGVLSKTDEVDNNHENNFIFDIDCLQTMKGLDGRERRLGDVSLPENMENGDDRRCDNGPEFCVDAGSTGNIARFINHSCQPNLFVQCVLNTHQNIKLARVMLFAADNIPPLKELTYDYGYALDSVLGPDGCIKQMACYCGAADCRKRLF